MERGESEAVVVNTRTLPLLATLAVLLLAGCMAPSTAVTPETNTTTDTSDPAAAIDYDIRYVCDHYPPESDDGKAGNECAVDFSVSDSLPDGVEYVELHVSDAIDSETESYLITDVETLKYAYASDHNYGDVVIVEAQLSSGERVVLENHTLSCADVSYTDACAGREDTYAE